MLARGTGYRRVCIRVVVAQHDRKMRKMISSWGLRVEFFSSFFLTCSSRAARMEIGAQRAWITKWDRAYAEACWICNESMHVMGAMSPRIKVRCGHDGAYACVKCRELDTRTLDCAWCTKMPYKPCDLSWRAAILSHHRHASSNPCIRATMTNDRTAGGIGSASSLRASDTTRFDPSRAILNVVVFSLRSCLQSRHAACKFSC